MMPTNVLKCGSSFSQKFFFLKILQRKLTVPESCFKKVASQYFTRLRLWYYIISCLPGSVGENKF